MKFHHLPLLSLTAILSLSTTAQAAPAAPNPAAPKTADFYHRETIPLPKGEVMEIGSIALMPGKKVAVTTRRGDIWICEGAYDKDLTKVKWTLFHRGVHEPLGMFFKDGWLYFTDRAEYARMRDTNGDLRADEYECINDDWGINGDYHEFSFGTTPDKDGNVWAVLCLTGSANASSKWRGWGVKITPDGKMTPTTSGIRSPGGIGYNAAGDVFYTDNQGLWNGTSCIKHLKPGAFTGNPSGNHFYKDAPHMGPQPVTPRSGSRINTERQRIPQFVPPAVQIPHGVVGQSPTALITDLTKGKFGPFAGQLLVGEQTHSEVQRVSMEKVNGIYQGVVWKLIDGFRAGIVPMRLDPDGTLFTGGTNRGWASRGGLPFSFERVRWTGVAPLEMKNMTANKDGFTLTFTEPVDAAQAADLKNYSMRAWTYIYQHKYGSPQVDHKTPAIKSIKVSPDGLQARLYIDGLVQGHIHHLNIKSLMSKSGKALWHKDAYYTLNEIPK